MKVQIICTGTLIQESRSIIGTNDDIMKQNFLILIIKTTIKGIYFLHTFFSVSFLRFLRTCLKSNYIQFHRKNKQLTYQE